MTTFTTPLNQVSSLYVGYFGRAGDPSGENYWISQLNAGAITLSQMAASFSVQPEATAKYPYLANPNINDPGAFVDQVYQNMFNHAADAAGKAYWVAQLNSAKGSASAIGSMILNIISGATGTDDTTIKNKVDVSSDFTTKAANAGLTWNAQAAAQSSTEIAATNDTAASVTVQKAATDLYIASAPGPQQTFTLALDVLTLSTQNANFNAPLIFNPATGLLTQSLQIGDSAIDTAPLTGPGLSNGGTLTATLNSGAMATLVTLQGIPTHTVTSITGGSGYAGSTTGISGLVTLNNVSSTGSLTIGAAGAGIDKGGVAGTTTTGATLLSTVNIANVTGTTATAATTVIVNTAALAGAADALAINIAGTFGTGPTTLATANTVSVKNDTAAVGATDNAYETINLSVAGQTNLALADAGSGILSTTTLNLASLGSVTLWSEATEAHFTKLTTIIGSAQVGGFTVTGASSAGGLLTGSVLTSFRGGLGVDSVDLSSMTAAQLSAMTATNLDGGIGSDTLILSVAQGATTTVVNNTGFEVIGLLSGTLTMDYSKFGAGVTTINLIAAQTAADTFNNLTSGMTFGLSTFHAGFAENFNAAGTGLADTLTVNFTGAAAVGKFTTTGFEVVNTTVANFAGAVGWAGVNATPSAGDKVTDYLISIQTGVALSIATENLGTSGTLNIAGTGTSNIIFTTAPVLGALTAAGYGSGLAATAPGISFGTWAVSALSASGTAGADTLLGSPFADVISGGAGNDVLGNMNVGVGGVGQADVITTGTGVDQASMVGDVASGALPALYSTATVITDFTVGTGAVGTTDFITLVAATANYAATFGSGYALQAAATAQGAWTVQAVNSTVAITNAANELVKLTNGVAAGATLQATFNAAIGTIQVTGSTADRSYFFTMYDITNSKMIVGIVQNHNGNDTKIESGDVVTLVGTLNMTAADYANLSTNHFSVF